MAEESFENPAIAAILNRYFVNVKVDREERPDVDRVYMAATQAMTGKGGWPMSVFLTHDLKPFLAGTYYPPQASYGLPGFGDLLTGIHKAWTLDKANLLASADEIIDHLKKQSHTQPGTDPMSEEISKAGYGQIAASYDEAYGGFGGAPKLPQPAIFNFLLRYYHRTGNKKALDMTPIARCRTTRKSTAKVHFTYGRKRRSTQSLVRKAPESLTTTTELKKKGMRFQIRSRNLRG